MPVLSLSASLLHLWAWEGHGSNEGQGIRLPGPTGACHAPRIRGQLGSVAMELAKAVGGIAWAIGIVFLFVDPGFGIPILLVALTATIWVTTKTRQKRHEEIVAAQRKSETPAPSQPPVSERLAELDKIREAGGLSDEEYETRRQQILDSL